MNSMLFKLGPVCWPEMLMAKVKYRIRQRDLQLSFKTDSGSVFTFDCHPSIFVAPRQQILIIWSKLI